MFDILTHLDLSPSDWVIFAVVAMIVALGMIMFDPNSNDARMRKRLHAIIGDAKLSGHTSDDPINAELRRRQIRSAMNESAKKGQSTSFKNKLAQSGLGWSVKQYALISVGVMILTSALLLFAVKLAPAIALLLGLVIGGVGPYFFVKRTISRRLKNFSNEFPTALDIIVRGVSAGLPLSECLKTISNEAKDPVRGEFKKLLDDQAMGMPLEKAIHRLAIRVPLAETSFFAIVLAVQSRSGGSLSEVLTNLSNVVRGRKMLDAQIKTMSAEAKMSGRLIGSMPILVAGALFYLSPDYISTLTGTGIGRMILAGCGLWMFTGIMVMKKMINFDV